MAPPLSWTPIWLSEQDIENGINRETLLACFDDGEGNFQTGALLAIIAQAEVEVLSWLGDYGPPPFTSAQLTALGADYFLRSCALEYAKAFVYDRHPEYVRANGKERSDRLERCDQRMTRVLDARQRPPQTTVPTKAVGGAVVDGANRIWIDSPGGPSGGNAGDYITCEASDGDVLAALPRLPIKT